MHATTLQAAGRGPPSCASRSLQVAPAVPGCGLLRLSQADPVCTAPLATHLFGPQLAALLLCQLSQRLHAHPNLRLVEQWARRAWVLTPQPTAALECCLTWTKPTWSIPLHEPAPTLSQHATAAACLARCQLAAACNPHHLTCANPGGRAASPASCCCVLASGSGQLSGSTSEGWLLDTYPR